MTPHWTRSLTRPLFGLLLAFAAVAAFVAPGADSAQAQRNTCSGQIAGMVLDANGQGVAAAQVKILVRQATIASPPLYVDRQTDGDGNYSVTGLCAGEYRAYAVWATSAARALYGQHDANADGIADDLELDTDDAALADIDIVLDSGRPYHPLPRDPNQQPTATPIPAPSCEQIRGGITGQVTDANGPVEGVRVMASRSTAAGTNGRVFVDTTDADGRYGIGLACAGQWTVAATKELPNAILYGFYDADGDDQPDPVELTVFEAMAEDIDIQLSSRPSTPTQPNPPACPLDGSIEGVVTGSNGQPIPGASIRLIDGRTVSPITASGQNAVTGEDGSYRVTGLCEGSYLVAAMVSTMNSRRGEARFYDPDGNGEPNFVRLDNNTPDAAGIDIEHDGVTPLVAGEQVCPTCGEFSPGFELR